MQDTFRYWNDPVVEILNVISIYYVVACGKAFWGKECVTGNKCPGVRYMT